MADAWYVGSLVIEKISPKPKGAPSVELIITSNSTGEIIADAVDLDAHRKGQGDHYHLNISLASFASFNEDGKDILVPDFELESYESPPRELYGHTSTSPDKDLNRRLPLILIAGGVVVIVLWLGIWFFLTGGTFLNRLIPGFGKTVTEAPPPEVPAAPVEPPPASPVEAPPVEPPPAPPVEVPPAAVTAAPPPEVPAAPPPVAKEEPPVIEAPAAPKPAAPARSRERPLAPVTKYKVPTTIPRGGVPYKIQWGDTLWEISEAFYRNPWLYSHIARFNNIRNPNRIISGTTIRIPPRN
ncbi:MAG: LysM peptidoglycan-binding domain-containing protein [Spirochaetaceae bacterium]|nr:LysM peptidoglycan-binding domain-containing protein [Spirochaetaceae bacterium]